MKDINHHLVMLARDQEGREPSPTAGVVGSQSAKTTESGGPRGFDAGKKVKSHKRHVLTDTVGYLISAIVHTADVQDRNGVPDLLAGIRYAFPWLRYLFADAAYSGQTLENAFRNLGSWTFEMIRRSDAARGFEVLPRRWVVERTLAWFTRNRRLAKDFENAVNTAETWLYLASIQLLARRLGRA